MTYVKYMGGAVLNYKNTSGLINSSE